MLNQTQSSMLSIFFVVASAIFSPTVSFAGGPKTAADWNSHYRHNAPQSTDTLRAITNSRNSTQERVGACMAGGGSWTANDSCSFPAENRPTLAQQQSPGAAESDGLPGYTHLANAGAANGQWDATPEPSAGAANGQWDATPEPSAGAANGQWDAAPEQSGEARKSCEDEATTAQRACLFPGTAGMDDGSSMMYTMMMNQLVSTAAQIASIGKNMSAQCKLQGDVAKVMGTINGVKGATCMKMISSCGTTCTDEVNEHRRKVKEYESKNQYGQYTTLISEERKSAGKKSRLVSECKSHSMQVVAMMNGAMQNLGNFAQAKQCQNELAAFAAPPPLATLPPVAGIGDCSDPANQSLSCFCTRPANAASAMCAGFGGGTGGGGGTTTTPNGSTIASPVGGSVADATDGNTVDPFAIPKKDGAGDGKGQGDGGSGAPGGSGLSALGSEGGGAGGAGDSRSAITGTSGGNGSGLGSAGGGGGGGGLSRNNGGAKEGFFDKFNLKKFLPGSKYKTRGIAGMSVKSVDGITGPMGPSLFEKATRQYQEQIQKQNVILDK